MKKAGIIGYGRFGMLLADLLSKKYEVSVYDIDEIINGGEVRVCGLEEVLECILVFIAVPINSFEEVVKEINSHIGKYVTFFYGSGQKISNSSDTIDSANSVSSLDNNLK